jgi:hypothetical protein
LRRLVSPTTTLVQAVSLRLEQAGTRTTQASAVANSAHFTSIQVSFGLHIALWPLNYRS